jgi:2,4-dienoyl-CoA reductase-like NADH-dependent reductase (Old Yellow Enzyme family)
MSDQLFTPYPIGTVTLRNRLTMAPLYLGYAGEGGMVSKLLLEHYRLMARSGVALVVVENTTIDFGRGRGSPRTLRADTDDCLEGLAELLPPSRRRARWPHSRSTTPDGLPLWTARWRLRRLRPSVGFPEP